MQKQRNVTDELDIFNAFLIHGWKFLYVKCTFLHMNYKDQNHDIWL